MDIDKAVAIRKAMVVGEAIRKAMVVGEAIAKGRNLFNKANVIEEFNSGCDHVLSLFESAYELYKSGIYHVPVFLAISAIEEIAKLEVAMFRCMGEPEDVNKQRQDKLYNHRAKHVIALQEVIAIGSRLPKAIGKDRVRALLDMAEAGGLVALRESSLYTDSVNEQFVTPASVIDKATSREIILLAIETWDDRLRGLTNHTNELDRRADEIFYDVAG
ncbi:AbiV family abortive infection protein [Vibrio alginolyticus]|nr:AbiV family abortive infection protein [Vibrio alginolyticus]